MTGVIHDGNLIKACIFGHAVADALGLPVQFKSREEIEQRPVTDMFGYGVFHMPEGSWSDDTSMTLCALDALSKERFSWDAVMRNFQQWLYQGKFTPSGFSYDIGRTCMSAIDNYTAGKDYRSCGLAGDRDNGNGSLMRIIPFVLVDPENAQFIETASALTHAHLRSRIACVIYSFYLHGIVKTKNKNGLKEALTQAECLYGNTNEWQYYKPLYEIESRTRDSISGSGYVVDTLEAAIWCLMTTESYRECVLRAVNLGLDTDTVAAIAGGLAGALYGYDSIPGEWLDKLKRREYIDSLCETASEVWSGGDRGKPAPKESAKEERGEAGMPQGEIIRKYRLLRNLTQERLAEKLDVSYQAVSNWENGKTSIDTDHLTRLSEVLNVSMDILTGRKEDEPNFSWQMKDRFFNEEKMKTFLKGYLSGKKYYQSLTALDYAKKKHDATGAKRKIRDSAEGVPYINHPFTLACHAIAMGIGSDDLITALLLHDVCEDCNVAVEDLPGISDAARETVRLVTKPKDNYYEDIMKNPTACMVKCLDRCNNVSMMAMGFTKAKIMEYVNETEEKIYPMLDVLKATPEYNNAYWLLSYQIYACVEAAKNFLSDFS